MAYNSATTRQELRKARNMQKRYEDEPAQNQLQAPRSQQAPRVRAGLARTAQRKKAAEQAAKRAAERAATAAAPAAGALPSITGTRGTGLRRSGNTFTGRGGPVTAAEAMRNAANPYAGTFQERLARFREANAIPREDINRGFQYQPSRWAQDLALRNARKQATQTVSTKRGWQKSFDPDQFAAIAEADPRLQGLARSKLYQDTRNADLVEAVRQRGQDTVFYGAAGRDRSQERVATGQTAAELAKSRAQQRFEAEKYGIERGDVQRQQNLENMNQMLEQRSARFEDPQEQFAQRQRDLSYLINSGVEEADTGTQMRVLNLLDQFGEAAQYDQSVRDSMFPILARAIGGIFRKDGIMPESSQQLETILINAAKDPRNLEKYDLNRNEIAQIQSLFGRR